MTESFTYLLIALALMAYHFYLNRNDFSILNPFVVNSTLFTFYFVFYPVLTPYSVIDYTIISRFAMLGFLFYFLGYHANTNILLEYKTPVYRRYQSSTELKNTSVIIVMIALLTVAAIFYKSLFFIPVYILINLIILSKKYKKFIKIAFIFLLFLIFLYIFLYVVHERRYLAVIIICFALLYNTYINKIKALHLVFTLPLFLYLALAGSIIRGGGDVGDISKFLSNVDTSERNIEYSLRQVDVGVIYPDVGLLLTTVPDDVDYLYGSSLFKPLFWLIPRSIWNDKPETVGRKFTENNYPKLYIKGGSRPVLLPGEFYYNFGFIGVAVGMLLYGVFTRYMYIRFYKKYNLYYFGIYIIFLANSVAIFRGGIAQNIHTMIFFMIFPYIIIFLSSKNIPKKIL